MYENPLYEQRRNLDRQAGLALEASGKKRKHDSEEKGNKDKEEKSKHKKDKEKKESEADVEAKREEVEDNPKLSKKEEAFKPAKSQERDCYRKKDEVEKYKYTKKDDKYRHSRNEEESGKYSRRGEDDRYSREDHQYRYRRDHHERCDDRPKYGLRDEEDKPKYSPLSDFRSKYDTDQKEGNSKAEKEPFKSPEIGKPEASKADPHPKPYHLSKVLCGPSPAMRAKLRKQSLEAGKPLTATTSFGKFTWKKKENVLAKEAEKVAAEFIREDEEASQQQSVEDSFAKSVAVAKEIAQKLAGQDSGPPSWESNGANKVRPNLPTPAAVLRKMPVVTKPASLNTFLSIRPETTKVPEPSTKDIPHTKDQKALLEAKPGPVKPVARPGPMGTIPAAAKPELFEAKSLPVRSAPPVAKPVPPPWKPPGETKPALCKAEPVASEGKALLQISSPASHRVNPAPLVLKPEPVSKQYLSPDTKVTQSTLIKIVPDVAAPGVPESEQIHTVFVKPPPFLNIGDGGQKSDKLKSNLAAAKAQDLFGIFYSSMGRSGPSSITKPTTRPKTYGSSTSPLPAVHLPKQPTWLQPPSNFHLAPQSNARNSTAEVQTLPLAKVNKPNSTNSTPGAQPVTELCTSAQPDSHHSSPTNDTFQSLPPCKNSKSTKSDSHTAQAQAQPQAEAPKVATKHSEPRVQTEGEPPANVHTIPQLDLSSTSTGPQSNAKFQMVSICSLQPTLIPAPAAPPSTSQTTQAKPTSPGHTQPHNQPLSSKSESIATSQTLHAEQEPTCWSSQTSSVLQSDLQLGVDSQPEPQAKQSPKTRSKTTATKKNPPAPRPVRQTRYQTRRQQQSQSEAELTSGDSDSAASEPKHLDLPDPSSGSHSETVEACEVEPQTPENLSLPSDTSLDFESDLKFE